MIVLVKLYAKNTSVIVALAIIVLSISWSPLAFIATVFVFSQIYVRVFRNINLINGLFLGTLSSLAFITIAAFLIDLIIHEVSQFTIIHILLVLVIALYLWAVRGHIVPYAASTLKYSILSLILAVAASVFMLIPAYNNRSSEGLIHFLSSGEDNASHFAMLNYNMTYNSPPYFNKDTGLIPSLNIYPQGVQSSAAFLYESIFGNDMPATRTILAFYYLITVTACAALVFVTSELIGLLARPRYKYLVMTLGAFTIFLGVVLFLAGWGFMTQIVSLVYILAFTFTLVLAEGILGKIRNDKRGLAELILYGTLLIGVVFSWYLLILVFVSLLLTRALPLIRRGSIKSYIIFIFFGLLALGPIALNIFAGKGSGAINEPGGVYVYEAIGATTMVIGLGIFLLFLLRNGIKNEYMPFTFTTLFAATYVTTLIIGSYQLLTAGELLYYFYKSLYLTIIVAILLFLMLGSSLLQNINGVFKTVAVYVVILGTTIFGYLLLNPTYPQVYLNNWFRHVITPQSVSQIVSIKQDESNVKDVINDIDCDYIKEYILNRWSGALFLSEQNNRSEIMRNAFRSQQSINISDTYLAEHPQTKVVTGTCD